MYLHDMTIKNYRKFGNENNTVQFVGNESDIDIAESSTLIIGKNNSGKTTIANALSFILNSKQPQSTDFNLLYLQNLVAKYVSVDVSELESEETPEVSFTLNIKYDDTAENGDLLANLGDFVDIGENSEKLATIVVRYSIREEQDYWEKIKNKVLNANKQLEAYYELLDDTSEKLFRIDVKNSNGNLINNFNLNKLIKLEIINAESRQKNSLSEVFSKIVSYQFTENKESYASLKRSITEVENKITATVETKQNNVSEVLQAIESNKSHVDFSLTGNVDENTIFSNLVKYHFADEGDNIPETQFGLGYIHLLKIIGSITHYIDSYERDNYRERINLLFIEEPEAFMHPQMQEFFILRINKAVEKAIELAKGKDKDKSNDSELQCQVIITTHSSHIVNSKITASGSFDNINYISSTKKNANVILLNDEKIQTDRTSGGLSFMIKHIKYKVSELFFSDAIVFVEGVTEEALLKYYLDTDEVLKNYYISVFNINGAHAKVYYPLIKALKVPCLIITDLDIKREDNEKGKGENSTYLQLSDLVDRVSTNDTLKEFHRKSVGFDENIDKDDNLANIIAKDYFEEGNLRLTYQKEKIGGYYATSLEEAFILTNFDNDVLNSTLRHCKRNTYLRILRIDNNGENSRENLREKSYELQQKLSEDDGKTKFTSELLYQILCTSNPNDDGDQTTIPELPKYIKDGFVWLSTKLQGGDNG